MPSLSSNPIFSLYEINMPGHPSHPAFTTPDLPITLTQWSPGNYRITYSNPLQRNARIFLRAFTDPNNPLWTPLDEQLAAGITRTASFAQSSLNGATTIWLGSWWDDGTYSDAAAYFAAHPSDPNHHTVPITTG